MRIPGILMAVLLVLFTTASIASAVEGWIAVKSPYSAEITMNRLEKVVKHHKLTVFARIDHAKGAASIGKSLRPTVLLIFGNPKGGTLFMACAQTVGIDLPLKALVWEDASKQVWLGYNDPRYIAKRHGAEPCPVVKKLRQLLTTVVQEAVSP